MPELPKKIRGHCGGHLLFEKDGRKHFKLLFRPIFGLSLNIAKTLGSFLGEKKNVIEQPKELSELQKIQRNKKL
jgi:hypothetical protein